MIDLSEYIYSKHILTEHRINLVHRIDNSNYRTLVKQFKSNPPFSGVNVAYSFESLNSIFFGKNRVKYMRENTLTINRLNILIYDFDIFNFSFPTHSINTLDAIIKKYEQFTPQSNKLLIFSKPNEKLFKKNADEDNKKLFSLIEKMNVIDISQL